LIEAETEKQTARRRQVHRVEKQTNRGGRDKEIVRKTVRQTDRERDKQREPHWGDRGRDIYIKIDTDKERDMQAVRITLRR